MPTMLEVEELKAGYTKTPIVNGVSLRCERGQVTTIVGPNGCGKSTLLKAIVGLLRPSGGRVVFNGVDIFGRSPQELLLTGLALVPQARSVFPRMTVEENVRLGGYVLRDRARIHRRVDAIYALFPQLKERRRQLAGTLSGGEQRILELARAMILDPTMLLLDEPSAMLAPALLDTLFKQIREICTSGVTVLLVEQNIRKAFEITDQVYVLDYGHNSLHGTPAECLANPELATLYLGGESAQTGAVG